MVSPRQYVAEDPEALVAYDGLPLVPSGAFRGHRASELKERWGSLPSELEGRFICLRILAAVPEIEVITDPLGVAQLYFWESSGRSVISNSAGLVQRFLGSTLHDPVGVSMFLAMDWVGSDRTLRRDVRVAPAGQHWSWRAGDTQWRRRTHWSIAQDAAPPSRRVDDAVVGEAIDGITAIVRAAAGPTGSVNAPLTGGKDSRMLAAVLMASGVEAKYWTKGDPGSLDVSIAKEIADTHRLSHRIANRPTQQELGRDPTLDVAAEWSGLTRQFVLQNDGLASIFLVANIQGQPDHADTLAVTLSAMCAESARAVEAQEYLCGPGASVGRTARYLPYAVTQIPRGLVREAAYTVSRRVIRDWVEDSAAAGVPVENLPVTFYLDERCRRWASNNPRELAQTEDKVLPFMTRQYVGTVLSLKADERANHRLHRGIIRRLVPALEQTPTLDIPWRTASAYPSWRRRAYNHLMASMPYGARRLLVMTRELAHPTAVGRAAWSPYDEASWLDANLDHAREAMLSRGTSPLWDFLNRRMLEHLLAPDTPPAQRRLHQLPLFAAYTMFLFEQIESELQDAATASPAGSRVVDTDGRVGVA